MGRSPAVPSALHSAPFRGAAAVAAGLLTRRQLAGPSWLRLLPDVYVHVSVNLDHDLRCRAVALWLGDRGAISGLSAAYLWGVRVLERDAPVEVTLPRAARKADQPGVIIVRSDLLAGDVVERLGLGLTGPVRTAFDIARRVPRVEAIVALDALLRGPVHTVADVAKYAEQRVRWPGANAVAPLLDEVEPLAESPMETRLRLVLVDGGLPRPVAQHEVHNRLGRMVARLDLAYPDHRLGIEYEGAHHRERDAFQRDLRRYNTLRGLGWTALRFGPDDVLQRPDLIVGQVARLLGIDLWKVKHRMPRR
jgi:very-short-patch-repair endonuclease